MSDVKCVRMLFRAAEGGIAALSFMRDSEEVPDEVFGFHIQQATEKLLEARLAALGKEYPLTHNLEALLDLLDLLAEYCVTSEPFHELIKYTPHAVEFRYLGVGPDAEAIDREDAMRLVEMLLKKVGRALQEAEGA